MQNKIKLRKSLIVIAVVLVLSLTTVVLAKYLINDPSGYKQAGAKGFYMTTSFVENDAEHPYFCADTISLAVNNNDGLNVSRTDVNYTVSITGEGSSAAEIELDGVLTDNGTIECNGSSFVSSDVLISNLKNGDYAVTISSTYPYEKDIKLYFRSTQGSQKSTYKVTKHGTWAELDLYTGSSSADITITHTGYSPDNTNDIMSDWQTDGPSVFSDFSLNSHYKLVFFGDGDFVLKQKGETLVQL